MTVWRIEWRTFWYSKFRIFCQISKFDEVERAVGCSLTYSRDDRWSFLKEQELHEPRTVTLTHAAGLCVAPGYCSPELSFLGSFLPLPLLLHLCLTLRSLLKIMLAPLPLGKTLTYALSPASAQAVLTDHSTSTWVFLFSAYSKILFLSFNTHSS